MRWIIDAHTYPDNNPNASEDANFTTPAHEFILFQMKSNRISAGKMMAVKIFVAHILYLVIM